MFSLPAIYFSYLGTRGLSALGDDVLLEKSSLKSLLGSVENLTGNDGKSFVLDNFCEEAKTFFFIFVPL